MRLYNHTIRPSCSRNKVTTLIKIVAYTSQTCPYCGQRKKAKDQTYQCTCGYTAHRDRVGAINIMRQPVADGNSLSA
ncbi:zinc ribbon domain-containing protein [Paenibacillus periandrae]|uniref:zinc ribbon domain-containing protein n=1 Tax=Paenibacillus periandrae TaxID=1761741 RepID=UPI0030845499